MCSCQLFQELILLIMYSTRYARHNLGFLKVHFQTNFLVFSFNSFCVSSNFYKLPVNKTMTSEKHKLFKYFPSKFRDMNFFPALVFKNLLENCSKTFKIERVTLANSFPQFKHFRIFIKLIIVFVNFFYDIDINRFIQFLIFPQLYLQ